MISTDGISWFYANLIWIILGLSIWGIPWKIIALWRAARNKHLWWFIAIFLVNTLAILEIVYIFKFSKEKGYED